MTDQLHTAKEIRTAIKNGQLITVQALLKKEPDMLNRVTPFGTWLHVAAAHGQLTIADYLLQSGIDRHARCGTFSTNALERAATKGHIEIVEYLLTEGVGMDLSEPERNPLFAAIYGGHMEIVRRLVEQKINVSVTYTGETMKNMNAYDYAVERGQTEIAAYLKQVMDEGCT